MAWSILGASALTTLGTLPVFLLGAQSVAIRADLDFGQLRFGVAVATFFAAAAGTALAAGGLVDRWGRRRSTVLAGLLCALGGLAVVLAARSWVVLLVAMAVLGVANAACQLTSNLAMATAIPAHRRGLGFGVKQAAVPTAVMLAGLAVPTLGATGWRSPYVLTTLAGVAVAVAGLRSRAGRRTTLRAGGPVDRPPRGPLLVTMAGILLASAAANSLGAYVAAWGFEVGLTTGQAGSLMAVGSALNVGGRLLGGHLADRRHGRNLPVVSVQMVLGGVALAALAVPLPAAVVPAAVVAFAVGWSWPGLLIFAVVRIGRDAPAAASGVLQAGAFVGGSAGPLLFGAAVSTAGWGAAWVGAAAAMGAGGLLVALARRLFIADLVARPPRRPLGYGGGRHVPVHRTPEPPGTMGPDPRGEGDD